MDSESTEHLAYVAREAALVGGQQLLEWRHKFEAREKGPADLVTDADIAAQEAVRSLVAERFPHHAFVGEEQGEVTQPSPGVTCWVVDPLDGTTNYVHQFPAYATSVAAARDGVLLAGAIYNPLTNELFWAGRGLGAWLGERRLQASNQKSLAQSLIAMSLPPHVREDSPDLLDFNRVVGRCQGVRRIGSAALNMANVARGSLDAHWAREIKPWDVAAGVLLILEAEGVVTNSQGGPFDLWSADFVATATETLHSELLDELVGGPNPAV